MNDYHAAWLNQITQKEMYYLYILLMVVTIWWWYRWLNGTLKLAIRAFIVVIVLALGAGIWFLLATNT